jgi:hypothetical protein
MTELLVDKYPYARAAIEALAPTHAERRAMLDVSESHYFALLRGEDIPEQTLRRWLKHPSVIDGFRRDFGFLDAAAPCAACPACAEETVHVQP